MFSVDFMHTLENTVTETSENLIKDVVLELYEIGAIKFGSFQLKSGTFSPYYIDLRSTLGKPSLLAKMCALMWQKIEKLDFDLLCAVPYAAIALCAGMSLSKNKPMLMMRKEPKVHGTARLVEGLYQRGEKTLIVEDVITTGSSIEAVRKSLQDAGLKPCHAVVFIEREEKKIPMDIQVHSVLTPSRIYEILQEEGIDLPLPSSLSYGKRSKIAKHPVAKKLFHLMEEKKTNLALAADVKTKHELLTLADKLGPYICLFKTHIDVIEDFDAGLISELKKLSEKHRFLIFEDRKFADIGNTALMQYRGGMYKISSWADIINAHSIVGEELINALREGVKNRDKALLLIPELSSKNSLTDAEYAEKTIKLAEQFPDFVIGFIARKRLVENPELITMTPGVHLEEGNDCFGQQYLTPNEVIFHRNSDIIIVGRGLYNAENPEEMAKRYLDKSWRAYLERLKKNEFQPAPT